MIKDYFRLALSSLSHRKLRSWLTMIGIFIGITAFVTIFSLGQGLREAVNEQFSSIGNDKLWLQPGNSAFSAGASAAKLTDRDVRTVESIQGVFETAAMSYQSARFEFKEEQTFALIFGYTVEDDDALVDEIYGGEFLEGRPLRPGDTFKVVLGYDFAIDNRVFERRINLGDKILIAGEEFDVVGFRDTLGNSQDDQSVFITDDAYERIFDVRMEDDYKFIVIKTANGADPNQVAQRIKRQMRNDRNVDPGEEDFQLQTTEELQNSVGVILDIVNITIAGLAAISVVVGAIGIMNTMYTAVLERTNEIGIMKAIGARNEDILLMFLIESGLMGLVGGAVGVAFGLGVAKLVEVVGQATTGSFLLNAWWSWQFIVIILFCSFLLGAASGVFPAYQASKQRPVDALRYE